MPPRTRTTKNLKENAGVIEKSKHNTAGKHGRPVRKVLADKTNSASDENTSVEVSKKIVKKPPTAPKIQVQCTDVNRPQRERRLPGRFADNEILKNLSISKDTAVTPTKTNNKNNGPSPFKTPKQTESSLLASRPKRVSSLPSKFKDSISPNKYLPVQPCHASTPIVQKKLLENKNVRNTSKAIPSKNVQESAKNADLKKGSKRSPETNNNVEQDKPIRPRRAATKTISIISPGIVVKKATAKKVHQKVIPKKNTQTLTLSISSSNDGPSPIKRLPSPKKNIQTQQNHTNKLPTPRKSCPRIAKKSPINFSFRMLETKKSSDQNKDVYEFTFDPKEEPAPNKKKKRVVAKKRPAKPKTVIIKNNYNRNLSKSLTALKDAVSKKKTQESSVTTQKPVFPQTVPIRQQITAPEQRPASMQLSAPVQHQKVLAQQKNTAATKQKVNQNIVTSNPANMGPEPQQNATISENVTSSRPVPQNLSIPIEDIAADIDYTHQEINYSPTFPVRNTDIAVNGGNSSRRDDPMNIIEELSFFDQPIASSSMNVSRHPHASPWRVEFERLPIKWHINSYVKPNMTPAMECTFVNFEEGKKKHVYTNILPEPEDHLPEIVQNDQPNLVQSSIISFIKEVVDNSAKKKKRDRSKTPVASAIFDEVASTVSKPIRTLNTPKKSMSENTPISPNTPNEKENSRTRRKRKILSDENVVPAKTPRKEMDSSHESTFYGFDVPPLMHSKEKDNSKENTFFGFDESEDLENISPKEKESQNLHALRSRSRAVLKEINEQTGPTRAVIPVSVKTKADLNVVNKLYGELKSAEEAPVLAEKINENPEVTTVTETSDNPVDEEEDSQSVHLFEDIELVHHFKPQRKSYGKAKKVTFRSPSSDSDTQTEAQREDHRLSDDDNVLDLTFEMPAEEKKRKKTGKKKMTKKQKLSKKEEAEAEAWAAGFNSMCEDVEEFPLMVE